jgi:hypothetical protein
MFIIKLFALDLSFYSKSLTSKKRGFINAITLE